METIFISHKVEHPMTVMASYHLDRNNYSWDFPPKPHDLFVYCGWQFKTLELEEVKYTLPLN